MPSCYNTSIVCVVALSWLEALLASDSSFCLYVFVCCVLTFNGLNANCVIEVVTQAIELAAL